RWSRGASTARAGSCATAGRPASRWSPRSTTAARGRPPPCRPTPRSAQPRSAAGWSPWRTRTSPRNSCPLPCAPLRLPSLERSAHAAGPRLRLGEVQAVQAEQVLAEDLALGLVGELRIAVAGAQVLGDL